MTGGEITLRDVWDQQRLTAEQVSQMRGDLGTHMARVDERLASGALTMADHEARLRVLNDAMPDDAIGRLSMLEQFRWKMAGGAALAGTAGGSVAAALITWALGHH